MSAAIGAAINAGPRPPQAIAAGAPASAPSMLRPMAGLLGIFLAAMMAGLNNRVGALALADVRGALSLSSDDASWLSTVYTAGELIAMPFAAWFAITLSVRRFHLWMVGACTVIAVVLPLLHSLPLMLVLRGLQGVAGGALIPVLMMAALKFLPPNIRLHGLALYSMTATFAPNLAGWFAGQWVDAAFDWRWIYWQVIPVAALSALLVGWGLKREPVQAGRWAGANWLGMACAVPGLALLAVALDQGVRLDWFNSPLIVCALAAGLGLTFVYGLTEWFHPAPFMRLQMLSRRNLALGFTVFIGLLVVALSGSFLPAADLGALRGYRALQSAPIGLIIALPQLLFGPLVALLLYRKWADARIVCATGLALLAAACLLGSRLTSDWVWQQFAWAQMLQAVGQPMTVVALLFLATSVVQPAEGPYVSGIINTLRAAGVLFGSAVVGQFSAVRSRFHAEMLLDHAARAAGALQPAADPGQLAAALNGQAFVLATADAYRVLGALALALIPLALLMQYIPAPAVKPAASPAAQVH
ncbi:MAG TPA: MFS transporter [Burkholderiales bacterium]